MDFIRGEIPVFRRHHFLENVPAIYGSADLAGLETKLKVIGVAVEFGRIVDLCFAPTLRETGKVAFVIVSFYAKGIPTPGFRLGNADHQTALECPGGTAYRFKLACHFKIPP